MAQTTTIHASIKMTPEIKDMYMSIEYMEERILQAGENVEEEKNKLFDDVYNTVVEQINLATKDFTKK